MFAEAETKIRNAKKYKPAKNTKFKRNQNGEKGVFASLLMTWPRN